MKFRVYYRAFSNHEWSSYEGNCLVEANDEKEAEQIVKNYSDYSEEYFVEKVIEVQ